VADIVANFPGVAYVARGAVDKPNAIARTRRYLREAFRAQQAGEGFSLVEILTMCPTGWAVPTDQGAAYQRDQMNDTYPLGELRPRPTRRSGTEPADR
jgi:2-oxoglutarate ferredoxin oxidoreductase subunit beta